MLRFYIALMERKDGMPDNIKTKAAMNSGFRFNIEVENNYNPVIQIPIE
jgi:hypothetical protein